jgi:hypothetical protein
VRHVQGDHETEVGDFIVKEYVPVALALGALYPGYDNTNNNAQRGFAVGQNCKGWGAGLGNFLAWGNYPLPGGGNRCQGREVVDQPGYSPDVFMTGTPISTEASKERSRNNDGPP